MLVFRIYVCSVFCPEAASEAAEPAEAFELSSAADEASAAFEDSAAASVTAALEEAVLEDSAAFDDSADFGDSAAFDVSAALDDSAALEDAAAFDDSAYVNFELDCACVTAEDAALLFDENASPMFPSTALHPAQAQRSTSASTSAQSLPNRFLRKPATSQLIFCLR